MDVRELHRLAVKVARCVWSDDEAESAAGMATLKAIETYDPSRGTIETWVKFLARREAQYARRKKMVDLGNDPRLWNERTSLLKHKGRSTGTLEPSMWQSVADHRKDDFTSVDFPLLWEHYMERKTVVDMAADRGWTVRSTWSSICVEWQKFGFRRVPAELFPFLDHIARTCGRMLMAGWPLKQALSELASLYSVKPEEIADAIMEA